MLPCCAIPGEFLHKLLEAGGICDVDFGSEDIDQAVELLLLLLLLVLLLVFGCFEGGLV